MTKHYNIACCRSVVYLPLSMENRSNRFWSISMYSGREMIMIVCFHDYKPAHQQLYRGSQGKKKINIT